MHILYCLEKSIEKEDSIVERVLALSVGVPGDVLQDEMFVIQQPRAVRHALYIS
jgi:hypothetical protein